MINLQKWVIRIVSRGPFDAHANPIFVSLRILKFEDTIKLQISKVIYLNKKGLHPNSFNDMFCLTVTYIHIEVRIPSISPTQCRTNVRKFSLCFQGPKIFHSLSSEIQTAFSIALFNSKLKSFFLWYKDTLVLLMLVCSFSLFFSFILALSHCSCLKEN